MGNEAPSETAENVVDEVQLALVAGEDTETGDTVPILSENGVLQAVITTADGEQLTDALASIGDDSLRVSFEEDNLTSNLNMDIQEIGGQAQSAVDVANRIDQIQDALNSQGSDEVRVRILGEDDTGTLQESQVEALDTAVAAGTFGEITYLARALNSQGIDEFVSRVTDSNGAQIDPLTDAVLQSNAGDELRSRMFGPDAGGTLQQVNAESFDTALATTDIGVATYVARALDSQGQDELVSRITGADGVQVQEEALDTAVNPTSTALLTYLARALNSQGIDELVSRTADSSGVQIDPLARRDLPVGVDPASGAEGSLMADREFVATHRATGIADSNTAFQVVVSNPGGSATNVFVAPAFTTGGLANLDTSTDITIDTAGTALEETPKDTGSGSTTTATIEQGGSYTINGTTLQTILPGTAQVGGPTATAGDVDTASGSRLLRPGESVLYEVVNQSGSSASFSVQVEVTESPV